MAASGRWGYHIGQTDTVQISLCDLLSILPLELSEMLGTLECHANCHSEVGACGLIVGPAWIPM